MLFLWSYFTLLPNMIKKYIKKSKICYKITLSLQTCMCGCEFWQNAHPQRHTCMCACDSNFGKMHTCVRCACGRKSSVRMCVRVRQKIVATHRLKKTELWIFIKRKISVSGILHMKFWRKLTVCVDSLVCAVASLRLISLEAVGPLSLGSSHFKKARRVASSYIYWSLKKDNNIYRFITIHILSAYIEEKRPQILLSKFVLRGNN